MIKEDEINLLYKRFINIDFEEEFEHLPKEVSIKLLDTWKLWYEFSKQEFEILLWKISNNVYTLEELSEVTGTLNLSLRLIKVLNEKRIVKILDNKIIFSKIFKYENYKNSSLSLNIKDKDNIKKYCQFKTTWESSLKRANIIFKNISPNKSIFFLGDDDYTSFALSQYKTLEISVGDIDEELIKILSELCNIECHYFNVKDETCKSLQKRYNAVHCDPIDDGNALNLWINRSNELLKGEKGDLFFLNISVKRLGARIVYLQNFLSSLGFHLKDIIYNLSSYKVDEEPYTNGDKVKKKLSNTGFDEEVFHNIHIKTDMLIFERLVCKPMLFPSQYYEFRRKI
ncbi:MAG: bis-aminopropyl spermidine synthase family protein [Defluviitaleaceae bacterium]|nr:bis-aminopropyl spermidine synthase family protein [Defluviitaleaceae bacterium]